MYSFKKTSKKVKNFKNDTSFRFFNIFANSKHATSTFNIFIMRNLKQILVLLLISFPLILSAQSSKSFKYEYPVEIDWDTPTSASNVRDICFSPKTSCESDVYLAVAHYNGYISMFVTDNFIKPSEIKTETYITEIQYVTGSMLLTMSGYFVGEGLGRFKFSIAQR